MYLWLILVSPIAVSLALYYVSAARGAPLYPSWVVELHYAFFWFSGVFHSLRHEFHDITKKKSDFEQDMRWMVGYLFYAHILTALVLSLQFEIHVVIAYGGSLVVTIMLPIFIAKYLIHPYWKKRKRSEKQSPQTIAKIALATEVALEFAEKFNPIQTFVFDHLRENQTATCLLLHRCERPERNGLFEDRILQIPIDMKRKQAYTDNAKLIRYIFEDTEDQSAVIELEVPNNWQSIDFDQPLEAITLQQMDQAFPRYPTLHRAPLPIAVRQVDFVPLQEISVQKPAKAV